MRYVLSAGLLCLLATGPAFAVAPDCGGQLAAIKAEMSGKKVDAATRSKYEQAEKLCSQKKDTEAQALARQVREEMAGKSSGASGSGSTQPPAR
jgi:hypothetical protein